MHLQKSNKWDAARDVLLVSKRVEALSQLERTPRTYKKRKVQYWECELKEKRAKLKHKMRNDTTTQIGENRDANRVLNINNMSPNDLREALRKHGIKTRVRNVKRLQEMYEDAMKNAV